MTAVRVVIGPARDGSLIEVGAVINRGIVTIVHAMSARPVWGGRNSPIRPLPDGLDPNDPEGVADWFESDEAPRYFLGRGA